MRTLLTRALLLLALSVAAAAVVQTQSASGYQQLSVSSTAVAISGSASSGATSCRGRLEQAPIRVLWSGATPTSTTGAPVSIGDNVILGNANDVRNFLAIATSSPGTTGLLNLTCATGTVPEMSRIEATPTSVANLPVCNLLYRAAGVPCR